MDTAKFDTIKKFRGGSRTAERVFAQLSFATEISRLDGGKYDALIDEAVDYVCGEIAKTDALTQNAAAGMENILAPMGKKCKELEILCVAHAHIDMNWMWPYEETVDITLSTFRTMLNFLREYPDFIFSQSQA